MPASETFEGWDGLTRAERGGSAMENFVSSPFIVPVAGCALGAVAARGVPIPEIERLLGSGDEEKRVRDPLRSLGNARRAGIVLVSVGLGLMLFFITLYVILQERD